MTDWKIEHDLASVVADWGNLDLKLENAAYYNLLQETEEFSFFITNECEKLVLYASKHSMRDALGFYIHFHQIDRIALPKLGKKQISLIEAQPIESEDIKKLKPEKSIASYLAYLKTQVQAGDGFFVCEAESPSPLLEPRGAQVSLVERVMSRTSNDLEYSDMLSKYINFIHKRLLVNSLLIAGKNILQEYRESSETGYITHDFVRALNREDLRSGCKSLPWPLDLFFA